METNRTCTKCKEKKPISEFNYSHKALGYRRHECKECQKNRQSGWYNENHARETHKNRKYYQRNKQAFRSKKIRERNAKYQKKYRSKLKQIVHDAYGNVCACCGESEPMFLSIDHKNNDGYAMRKYSGHPRTGAQFYRWLIDNDFPDGFQLLCMNCNWGKAMNGGICPHQERATTIPQGSTAKRLEAHRTRNSVGDDMVSSATKVVAVQFGTVRK